MYEIVKAKLSDIDSIIKLIKDRIKWMDEKGINQWNKTDYVGRYPKEYFEENIDYFYIAKKDNKIVGEYALYEEDVRWPNKRNGYYIHHLATDLNEKGLGKIMILYAEELAKINDKEVVRFDSQIGNDSLSKYYDDLGYFVCGTCNDLLYNGLLREKEIEK